MVITSVKGWNDQIKILPFQTYRVLLNRGLVYYNNGDYNNALADFKLTVKDRPNDGQLYYTLGICYFKNNQFNEALSALAKAMELKV